MSIRWEKGYYMFLDGADSNARYLTIEVGRFVFALMIGARR